MKNILSIFPNGIDSRVFFSDIDLDNINIMNEHENLIKQGKYTDASQLLNNSDVFFYGAWFLNMIENRLVNIGNHLLSKQKPQLTTYQDSEPTENLTKNMVWIQ